MKIGIANEETWEFFHEIYADLNQHHQVSLFKRRATRLPIFVERRNRALFQQDLRQLLSHNDVVFFEWASELLAAASHMPKTCKIVTRLHRYEMYQWVDQVNWDHVDKIILVSKAKQADFNQRFPKQAHKTVVVNTAVAMDKFSFHSKPFSGDIGILCHITPRKRVYELILDFYELIQKNSTFHLHIGGDPHPSHADYIEAMQRAVKELSIEDKVTFYGPVANAHEWLRKIDIFVSNSYSEGLQVALLEAMATGCYCLSHDWSGVEELLPRENLYYTGSELQKLILTFAEQTEEEQHAQKMQIAEIITRHGDIEAMVKRIRQVVEEVGATAH